MSAFVSKNPKDTRHIARLFLKKILRVTGAQGKRAVVVGLSGNLGAGKTTFVKAAARELGIQRTVASPTFVIMKKYQIKTKNKDFLFHIDAYRLKDEKELLALGWEEIISGPANLIFIEWPEQVKKAMPKKYHRIQISHQGKNLRYFQIQY